MGPISELVGISCMARMKISDSFSASFSILHFFTFLYQNTPRKGVQKVIKIVKLIKKSPTRSSLHLMPVKRISKVWKSYPLQSFKPISKGPSHPKKHHKLNPNWTPDLQFVNQMGTEKKCKKQAANKSSNSSNLSQIVYPGAGQSSAKLWLFRNFLHPGPKMGQESSRGPKRLAQGIQKVPKGFQKVAKSHEKDIQKASTRHTNAISTCLGNSIS